ncbi:hypothetical protein O181_077443, partial [Austropuccinia psidii MF-1]|nr:hypothetical protein [Austropuccinia psidii MF-1]
MLNLVPRFPAPLIHHKYSSRKCDQSLLFVPETKKNRLQKISQKSSDIIVQIEDPRTPNPANPAPPLNESSSSPSLLDFGNGPIRSTAKTSPGDSTIIREGGIIGRCQLLASEQDSHFSKSP